MATSTRPWPTSSTPWPSGPLRWPSTSARSTTSRPPAGGVARPPRWTGSRPVSGRHGLTCWWTPAPGWAVPPPTPAGIPGSAPSWSSQRPTPAARPGGCSASRSSRATRPGCHSPTRRSPWPGAWGCCARPRVQPPSWPRCVSCAGWSAPAAASACWSSWPPCPSWTARPKAIISPAPPPWPPRSLRPAWPSPTAPRPPTCLRPPPPGTRAPRRCSPNSSDATPSTPPGAPPKPSPTASVTCFDWASSRPRSCCSTARSGQPPTVTGRNVQAVPEGAWLRSMPHITLNSDQPGIRGLLQYRPETGRPLSELAEVLLRGPGTLSRGERELIGAHVSALNDCQYCSSSHSATAAAQLPGGMDLVELVRADPATAPLSAKMKALLAIAAAEQRSVHDVTDADAGATDPEIHDTVLIAAMFCMFNRYVDGLATVAPGDPAAYAAGAQRLIREGYRQDES